MHLYAAYPLEVKVVETKPTGVSTPEKQSLVVAIKQRVSQLRYMTSVCEKSVYFFVVNIHYV